jgi:TolB-like protein
LLSETVSTLFANPRDEKLRQVLKLTYCQPGLKQEVMADRLSLSFGTYRRHLGTARDRLARWLWESWQAASAQSEPPPAAEPTAIEEKSDGETASLPATGAHEAPRLSIVILPFLNIGGSVEDEPFVDGITETLTTDLSRSPGVFAISRNTAFAYKGKLIDTRQIGGELGVRYVLEGSVQNAGERFRFNAQLVDAESGAYLWAARFDKQRADLFDMQDEVTARLTRQIPDHRPAVFRLPILVLRAIQIIQLRPPLAFLWTFSPRTSSVGKPGIYFCRGNRLAPVKRDLTRAPRLSESSE